MDTMNRLIAASDVGAVIDLVIASKEPVSHEAVERLSSVARSVTHVRRDLSAWKHLGIAPFQVNSRADLATASLPREARIAFLETEMCIPVLSNPATRALPFVVRVHNNEADFEWAFARKERRPLHAVAHAVESIKYRVYSPSALRRASELWFIDADTRRRYSERHPEQIALFVPPVMPESLPSERQTTLPGRVLCAGNLTAPTNLDGIDWYLKHVHGRLLHLPYYSFHIAGSCMSESSMNQLAQTFARHPRVTWQFNFTNADDLYGSASVVINPMQAGSSLKLKSLEAIFQNRPLVTTPVGITGVDRSYREGIFVESTPQGFADSIQRLLQNSSLRSAASSLAFRAIKRMDNFKVEFTRLLSSELYSTRSTP